MRKKKKRCLKGGVALWIKHKTPVARIKQNDMNKNASKSLIVFWITELIHNVGFTKAELLAILEYIQKIKEQQ